MSFHVPLDQRKPAPGWLWPLFVGVCILSCAAPRSLGIWRVAIAGPIVVGILMNMPNYDFGDVLSNFSLGVFGVGCLIKWIDVLLVHGPPEETAWRVPENVDDDHLNDRRLASKCDAPKADTKSWWGKLRWASSL